MGTSIAITSGKGGVGKSSITISLGVVLAQAGYKVCLIDVDLGLKNLDVMMGLENRIYYDLMDVMEGKCTLMKALVKDKYQDHLYLLPACKSIQIHKFKGEMLTFIIDELKKEFDYILLDTPAGIEGGFKHCLKCADQFILVTTLDVTSLQDADRIIGLLLKENASKIQLIINRCNPKYIEKGISLKIDEALSWLSIELLGVVYEDELLAKGNNHGTPIVFNEKSMTYICMKHICQTLLGESVQLPKYKEKNILRKLIDSMTFSSSS